MLLTDGWTDKREIITSSSVEINIRSFNTKIRMSPLTANPGQALQWMRGCRVLSRGNTQLLGLLWSLRARRKWGCFPWVTNHYFYNLHLLFNLSSLLFKSFPFCRSAHLLFSPVVVSDYNVFSSPGVGFAKISNRDSWMMSWRVHRKLSNGRNSLFLFFWHHFSWWKVRKQRESFT